MVQQLDSTVLDASVQGTKLRQGFKYFIYVFVLLFLITCKRAPENPAKPRLDGPSSLYFQPPSCAVVMLLMYYHSCSWNVYPAATYKGSGIPSFV
jgi:hypothetical protein